MVANPNYGTLIKLHQKKKFFFFYFTMMDQNIELDFDFHSQVELLMIIDHYPNFPIVFLVLLITFVSFF